MAIFKEFMHYLNSQILHIFQFEGEMSNSHMCHVFITMRSFSVKGMTCEKYNIN
jgi:hypothetical protein